MDSTDEEGAVGLEIADAKVGWVYKLNKKELRAELTDRRMSDSGNMEELRRRLVNHLRTNTNRPTRNPTPEISEPIETAVNTDHFELLNQLRKFNLTFDGKADPVAFLERIEQVREDCHIPTHRLLKALPGVLQGKAYQWYMNYRQHWVTYFDFVEHFKVFFYSPDYKDNLEEIIGKKFQTAHETAGNFILDMQTMIRRHGGYSQEREITCIYRRLRPEYRQYIQRNQIKNVLDLIQQAYDFEQIQTEMREEDKTRREAPQSGTFGLSNRDVEVRNRMANSINPFRPASSTTATRNMISSTNHTPTSQSQIRCWRCGNMGHMRANCSGVARLFCSRCGRNGTRTDQCPCQKSTTHR